MLQLKNNTPFAAAFALFPNEQGVDTLYTMVKASFNIGQQWTLAEQQLEPQKEDTFWGEPGKSSLRLASDYHTGKATSDIIMTGSACAPQNQQVRQMEVSVRVGDVSKRIYVFGDRQWNQGLVTSPVPFTSMPLVYERAFGGVDIVDGQVASAEERNPNGVGFAGKKSQSEMNGTLLPNLECPSQLIQYYDDLPVPVCFGPIAPHWQPRAAFAGTYDELWQTTRAPYLPEDYRPRFMNVAHPDLIYPSFLQGGEPVNITGMHPLGELNFNLPILKLRNKIHFEDSETSFDFTLETVLLDPNQLQLSLVYRSAFACDKKALKIKQITVGMLR
jgi:hypothetical protein